MKENLESKDIVIIGAGPAGLSAAIYAFRSNKNLALIEHQLIGGQLNLTSLIENYPGFPGGISGMELALRFKSQLQEMDIETINAKVESVKEDDEFFIVDAAKSQFKAKVIIIATGATPKKIGIPNEDKFIGSGVSFCATCDGPLYKNKKVMVVGGGDTALEEALFLTKFARKVFLMHRRDKFRAEDILRQRVKENEKIEILYNYTPIEIIGDDKVKAIKIKNEKTNESKEVDVDGVFIFVGLQPNSGVVKNLVRTDDNGFIITDTDMQTSKRGIFAAGDVRSKKFRQVLLACSEGAQAALSASKYIDEDLA